MLAVLRRQRILDELQRNGSALISGLAEQLSVSEMTIRRDLAGLERPIRYPSTNAEGKVVMNASAKYTALP